MHDQSTRATVLRLSAKGHGTRRIARGLGISRGAVRTILHSGSEQVPHLERVERAEPFLGQIREQFVACRGNLVRVHEELALAGLELSYPALTAFCRRHDITTPASPVGEYSFAPGREMQHDTSPHQAHIGGRIQKIQTASQVLCFSRLLFFQHYRNFTRFDCKIFLTEAALYVGGACGQCVIDNTHVIVLHGTGAAMVPVPEMAAFGERFGYVFKAHELGDADRKARVERSLHFIENNFLAGRRFADDDDINRQARAFCDKVNARTKRHLGASPRELFAAEQPHLRPLPLHVPEVCQIHHRVVDVSGYVTLHAHRYSVPFKLIGQLLELRETKDSVQVYRGPRQVACHRRVHSGPPTRVCLAEHRPPRGEGPKARRLDSTPTENALAAAGEDIAAYAVALKKRLGGGLSATLALRRLASFRRDYPATAVDDAVRTAAHFGLFDMTRLERMILRAVAAEYFVIPTEDSDEEDF